jgi:hypothetical protein
MALTLATTMRDAIADAVDTRVGTTATMEFQTSGDVEVATISLANPAFGASSTGTITLGGVPLSDTSATGGTMAKFVIKSGGTTTEITGTVGTSGENINFPGGLVVGAGDTVTLTSFTITCPAS